MTRTFVRGRKLLRLYRIAVLIVLVGLLGGAVPAVAAPTAEDAVVSTVQVDASKWGVSGQEVTRRRAVAVFPVGNVYCTSVSTAPNCLTALAGQVTYLGCDAESGGGVVNVVVRNTNRTRAPRDISVFIREGDGYRMFFGDRDWALRGKNVVEYSGIPDGTYLISVGWDDQALTFYGNASTIDCPPTG